MPLHILHVPYKDPISTESATPEAFFKRFREDVIRKLAEIFAEFPEDPPVVKLILPERYQIPTSLMSPTESTTNDLNFEVEMTRDQCAGASTQNSEFNQFITTTIENAIFLTTELPTKTREKLSPLVERYKADYHRALSSPKSRGMNSTPQTGSTRKITTEFDWFLSYLHEHCTPDALLHALIDASLVSTLDALEEDLGYGYTHPVVMVWAESKSDVQTFLQRQLPDTYLPDKNLAPGAYEDYQKRVSIVLQNCSNPHPSLHIRASSEAPHALTDADTKGDDAILPSTQTPSNCHGFYLPFQMSAPTTSKTLLKIPTQLQALAILNAAKAFKDDHPTAQCVYLTYSANAGQSAHIYEKYSTSNDTSLIRIEGLNQAEVIHILIDLLRREKENTTRSTGPSTDKRPIWEFLRIAPVTTLSLNATKTLKKLFPDLPYDQLPFLDDAMTRSYPEYVCETQDLERMRDHLRNPDHHLWVWINTREEKEHFIKNERFSAAIGGGIAKLTPSHANLIATFIQNCFPQGTSPAQLICTERSVQSLINEMYRQPQINNIPSQGRHIKQTCRAQGSSASGAPPLTYAHSEPLPNMYNHRGSVASPSIAGVPSKRDRTASESHATPSSLNPTQTEDNDLDRLAQRPSQKQRTFSETKDPTAEGMGVGPVITTPIQTSTVDPKSDSPDIVQPELA